MSLEIGKNADERSKCIIFGYFRKHELLFNISIPPIIHYFSMAYYYNPDYFTRARDDCILISDDKLTVTNIQRSPWGAHSIYLNKWIESTSNCIAVWKFAINKITAKYCVAFMIVSQELDDLEFGAKSDNFMHEMYDFRDGFKEGDEVTIKLDLKQCIISIQVNNKDEDTKPGLVNISQNIKYKMVAKVSKLNSSITLQDFSMHS